MIIAGAYLLVNLQPESTKAAIWLYNISLLRMLGWRSPSKELDRWFRNWFRQYTPAQIKKLTVDLRLDQLGIFAYGYRAYSLSKAKEARRLKRDFKTQPAGLIRYLVRYSASNIYRIWVPQIDQVIRLRNIIFNKRTFCNAKKEELEALLISIA